MLRHKLNSSFIPKRSHSSYYRLSLITQIAMMSERLPFMHIRDMNLHKRYVYSCQRVSQSNAGMCEGAWIDDNGVDVPAGFMYAVDYGAFPI
jgi:hypothetical protein